MKSKITILHDSTDIIKKLDSIKTKAKDSLICFYSNHINSIITDKNFMSIPIEDKMALRSFSIFDTTKIYGNKLFNINEHIGRFYESIKYIKLNPLYSKEEFKETILEVAEAARNLHKEGDIDLRFYYSAGLGSFLLNENENLHSFYVFAYKAQNSERPINGVKEFCINKEILLNDVNKAKCTNYLVNCIASNTSKKRGGYQGIFIDKEGNFLESSSACLGFVKNNIFHVPSFDKTLSGTTAIKALQYAEDLCKNGLLKGISRDDINIKDLKGGLIEEAMLLGGDFAIPILEIDDVQISLVKGEITALLQDFLLKEKKEGAYDIIGEVNNKI